MYPMGGMKPAGLHLLAPVLFMLVTSFFVLAVAVKQEAKALKKFGIIIAILLWVSAGLVLLSAVNKLGGFAGGMPCKGKTSSPIGMMHTPPMIK